MPVLEGALRKLELTPGEAGEPARCTLRLAGEDESGQHIELNGHLGGGVRIEYLGRVRCMHCGRRSPKSFGNGYCYPCFTTLARCDLCVVSPDRCHYHLGTCREPDWGKEFCMREHLVYLANTSGIKVGITRRGSQLGRWLDQGAIQALPILGATTRRGVGLAEVAIARFMPDRTDWKRLLRGEAERLDLAGEARALRRRDLDLPEGVRWLEGEREETFCYPVVHYPPHVVRIPLSADAPVQGNLLGIKGQYLLLSGGVFNVRRHAGYEVVVSLTEAFEETTGPQLDFFS